LHLKTAVSGSSQICR